jgi:transposase
MANKALDMTTLRQIIRLKQEGKSHKYIARHLAISRTTVVEYVKALSAYGLSWKQLQSMDEQALDELRREDSPQEERYKRLLIFFPYVEKELKSTGVTRQLLWEEYSRQEGEAYSYSQFCFHYQHYCQSLKSTAPLDHKAGDKLYVDFTGKLLHIIDPQSGELIPLQVFVAVLPASGYTYVKACYSQNQQDFIDCLASCLAYFGGVPQVIVPDNLKAAVTKSCRYEPELTVAIKQFALHYQTLIMPTRSYKPKDKAAVENAVSNVYRSFFAPLRHEQFFDLHSLNQALDEQLCLFNERKYQGRDYSRKELFDKIEKATLKELPQEKFTLKKQLRALVQKNGHIFLSEDKHYYSVPYTYIGQRVQVHYTASQVEIYASYSRIAFHLRHRKGYGYSTEKIHLSSAHRFVSDWSPEKFIKWGADIGKSTKLFIEKLFEQRAHPEQAYKSCMGVLALASKTGKERLENACKRALHFESYYYKTVKTILEKSLDKEPLQPSAYRLPDHANIRGESYYQ